MQVFKESQFIDFIAFNVITKLCNKLLRITNVNDKSMMHDNGGKQSTIK